MDNDSKSADSAGGSQESVPVTDGGAANLSDQAELYRIIHAAVKDALLDVIGTLLLVGIAFILVLVGGRVLLSSTTPLAPVIGLLLVLVGLYLAGATLEIIPPVRNWL